MRSAHRSDAVFARLVCPDGRRSASWVWNSMEHNMALTHVHARGFSALLALMPAETQPRNRIRQEHNHLLSDPMHIQSSALFQSRTQSLKGVNICSNKGDLFRQNMTDRPNLNSICSVTVTQRHFLLCCLCCALVHGRVHVRGRVHYVPTVTPPWLVLRSLS